MKLSTEKVRAVMALPAPTRYSHFVKVVADQDCMWGLDANGWALMETDTFSRVLPVWPAEIYAAMFATDSWKHYSPKRIELDSFFEEVVPLLVREKLDFAVFPVTGDKGVVQNVGELAADLRQELGRIE